MVSRKEHASGEVRGRRDRENGRTNRKKESEIDFHTKVSAVFGEGEGGGRKGRRTYQKHKTVQMKTC